MSLSLLCWNLELFERSERWLIVDTNYLVGRSVDYPW